MRIITVANQKGGVGKTTFTVNLAAAFSLMLSHENPNNPKRVLLIDMDIQANASNFLAGGLWIDEKEKGDYGAPVTLGDLLMESSSVDPNDIILTSRLPINGKGNLDYFPSRKASMSSALRHLESQDFGAEMILDEILEIVRDRYEYIFIDTPPALNLLTVNALIAAGHVIVPVNLEVYSIDGLNDLFSTIKRVNKRKSKALKFVGIQPSRVDIRRSEERDNLEFLMSTYKGKVLPSFSSLANYVTAKEAALDIFSFKPARDKQGLGGADKSTREFSALAENIRKLLK